MVVPGMVEMANLTRWSGLVGVKNEVGPGITCFRVRREAGFVTPAATSSGGPVVTTLEDAVARSVRPGDSVLVMMGHSRWTAAARELARQFWRTDPAFTLIMTSLGALGGAFFRGGLVRKVVTAYSGNSFPTYNPNPIFRQAYESGEVEVEHWSILTLSQRLEAAARGLPAAVTGSLVGSSMADNEAFAVIDSPFGPLGLLEPLVPDVALVHAAAADPSGNLVFSEPLLDGVWGAWAARRGVVATVERVVDDLEGLGHRVRVPGHRVLAVVEAPFGAHPGGCYAPGCPSAATGRTWRTGAPPPTAAARNEFDSYVDEWVLGPATHEDYLARVGPEQLKWLEGRSDPMSWKADADAHPVVDDPAISRWEQAASLGAREVERVVADVGADAVLAGAGVANLAAWVAVGRARAAGRNVMLTAELGLWGYQPTPADPYIFNQRVFPGHAVPLRRLGRARHGHRGPGDHHGGLPRRRRGRSSRVLELHPTGGRALPGRFRRGERRRQPGHRLRGRDAGPARASARDRRLRHLAGRAGRQRRDGQGHPAPRRRCAAPGRGARRGRGRSRTGCGRSRRPAGTSPTWPARSRTFRPFVSTRSGRSVSTTDGGCF